ncbi:MAG: OmpA family protein [Chitinophagia bacterium]|nr:OmpA family protein [Chitinophagia bacterium]
MAEYQGCPPPPPPPPPAPAEQDTFILNFKVNSSELDEYSKEKLKGLAEKLKNDKDYKAEVTVKGHADNTGTDRINIPLSKKRAYVVYNYLTKTLHVPKKRLQYPPVGKGSSEPLDDNSTPEGRAKNRRATIHFK